MVNPKDPRFTAAVDLLRRTGMREFQIRYCQEEKPTVWIAVGKWGSIYEMGAGINPVIAVYRLAETVIDGGKCKHCDRPAGFDTSMDTMPMDELVCWYQYDPGTKTFARGCA